MLKNTLTFMVFVVAVSHAFSPASAAPIGSGTVSGTFQNPVGGNNLVVSGVGTSSVSTGVPFGNSFQTSLNFSAMPFVDQPKGERFVAGMLEYTNGSTDCCSFREIDLELISSSVDPDFQQSLIDTLTFNITTNLDTNTDEQNADTVFFASRPDFGGFRVFEEATGVIQILAEFNSLELRGFGDVLTPNVAFLTEDPFAPVDPGFSAIPLPGAFVMAITSVALFGAGALRRRHSLVQPGVNPVV